MRYLCLAIAVTLMLVMGVGSALAQPTPPAFPIWNQSGGFVYNKKGDSLALIAGTDTVWFSANVVRHGLDSFTILGPTIEGDELGTGLLDSITDGKTAYGWGDHSAEAYADTGVVHDTAEVLRAEMGAGTGGWTDQDPYIILETIGDSVGIGTATPSTKLEVVGETTTDILTVTEDITVPDNSISHEELDESDNFTWTGANTWNGVQTFQTSFLVSDAVGDSPFMYCQDGDNKWVLFGKYDAGYSVLLNNEAELRFHFSNDLDDYIYMDTFTPNVPMIATGGDCDLVVTASSGEISFDDDNLTTTGTLDAGATTVTGNIVVSGTVDGVDVAALNDDLAADSGSWNATADALGTAITTGKITNGTIEPVDLNQGSQYNFNAGAYHADTTDEDSAYISIETLEDTAALRLLLAGGTMSGELDMGTNKIVGVVDPTSNQDAATKKYVDDEVGEAGGGDVTDVVGGNGLIDDSDVGAITLDVRPGSGIDTVNDLVIVDTVDLNANWKIATASSADQADTSVTCADENVEDKAAAMIIGGVQTQITVSYDDGNAEIDFVLDDPVDSADAAERATKDGDGSTISTTYLKLSGTGGGALGGNINGGDNDITNVELGSFDTANIGGFGITGQFTIDGEKFTGLVGTGLENDGGVLSIDLPVDSAAVAADAHTAHKDKDGDTIDVSTYLTSESSDADSLVGIDIETKTGNLQNNYILKVDISGADTTLQWEADATGGNGGTSVEILESNVSKDDPLVILNFMAGFGVAVADDTSYVTLDPVDLTADVTGTLPANNGGTGAATLTDHAVLIGSGTGAISNPGVLSSGQLLIGETGADPSAATLTEGNGIEVTNAAGSITLTVDESDNFTWTGTNIWNGTQTFQTSFMVDDGVGDSPFMYCQDGDNKYILFGKYDAGYGVLYNNEGELRFHCSDDADDYIYMDVAADVPIISTGGNCDLVINASSGEIDFDDENLTTTGNIVVSGTVDGVDISVFAATLDDDAEVVTEAELGDTTANYFDSAEVVDTIQGTIPAIIGESLGVYFDTLEVVDTVQGILVDYVTDANLTDSLDLYFDTATVVDTIEGTVPAIIGESLGVYFDTSETVDTVQGILVDYVTDANLTDSFDLYFDTAAVVDTIEGVVPAIIGESLGVYFDTAEVVDTIQGIVAGYLPLAGGQMSGNITMAGSETVDGVDISVFAATLDDDAEVVTEAELGDTTALYFDTIEVVDTIQGLLVEGGYLTSETGDIEGVTAGNGLEGGGGSGTVTLGVRPGHGIDTTNDLVRVDTADAVADAETKPVTGNAVFDFLGPFIDSTSEDTIENAHHAVTADTAGYASGVNPFVAGKLTVTGPIDRYNVKLEFDTANIYCPHADTILRLPIDTNMIDAPEDSFTLMHPSILYIPEGKWGYKFWLACTPPDGPLPIVEAIHILVSNDEVTWTEFMTDTDTLHNPVFSGSDFDDGGTISDPDIVWDENGDLFVIFRMDRQYDGGATINYMYAASTSDGITWDTTMTIDGYYNKGSQVSPDTATLGFRSPGIIMRGAGDYLIFALEDTVMDGGPQFSRTAWWASRIDTIWGIVPGFDSTILFGTTPLIDDTIRVSIVYYTLPAGNLLHHQDEILYGSDFIVNLASASSSGAFARIYMGVSTDGGEHFTVVSKSLLERAKNDDAWDHTTLYRASGYFIDRGDEVILRMYYCGRLVDAPWFTGLTDVHFGNVLHKKEALIWTPDGIEDTVPVFYADSALYPYGVEIQSLEVQTSEDGTYALKFFTYTSGDPPTLHDYIDTLNVGASDQRASSETFENDEASLIDRGQIMYILTPADDIDWIRVSFKFYVRDWQ